MNRLSDYTRITDIVHKLHKLHQDFSKTKIFVPKNKVSKLFRRPWSTRINLSFREAWCNL